MKPVRAWLSWIVVAVLAFPPAVFAMGFIGDRDVIHPAIDFKATLKDKDGVEVRVTRFNVGGDVQLQGDLGRGQLRIAFENIGRIDFAADSQDARAATIRLKNGEAITLKIRSSLTFYGQTDVGLYQIRARDLQSVDFGR